MRETFWSVLGRGRENLWLNGHLGSIRSWGKLPSGPLSADYRPPEKAPESQGLCFPFALCACVGVGI